MSKHARIRMPRSRRGRLVSTAAAGAVLVVAAGWAYAAHDGEPPQLSAQLGADARNRSAAAPPHAGTDPRTGRGAHRPRALPDISEATRAAIPASARQVVLVTGVAADSSYATASLYTRAVAGSEDWEPGPSWPARNGAKGWSADRTYGGLQSPVGVFSLTDAGGLLPAPPGTRLPYDHGPAFTATGRGVEGEPLTGSFDYVVAINYNRVPGTSPLNPDKPDGEAKGGNIWLHVDHDGPSQGCVGLPASAMKTLLETLDPARHPVVVMGPAGH
ncbi:L,D-transpeptidase family protein [Streptomyces bambusae]|uniref:L,D-transpeptidase family protein n=1 Tax=Streptomyces bambusae TaxID=1550616 RepID=UPI001CFF597A|nr:L,D-transpeptidase family protein [Streptomyces bambusae]MCB5170176.1 L,D-transpeptidase family protein [Streptomyces bambusae]